MKGACEDKNNKLSTKALAISRQKENNVHMTGSKNS